jgi:hypothetical protein
MRDRPHGMLTRGASGTYGRTLVISFSLCAVTRLTMSLAPRSTAVCATASEFQAPVVVPHAPFLFDPNQRCRGRMLLLWCAPNIGYTGTELIVGLVGAGVDGFAQNEPADGGAYEDERDREDAFEHTKYFAF